MEVLLAVTIDPADGTARGAVVAYQDLDRVASDPRLRAIAERAMQAVLNPRCGSNLVPRDRLVQSGAPNILTFRFRP